MLHVWFVFAMNNLSTFHFTYVIIVNSHLYLNLDTVTLTQSLRLSSCLSAPPTVRTCLTPDYSKWKKGGKKLTGKREEWVAYIKITYRIYTAPSKSIRTSSALCIREGNLRLENMYLHMYMNMYLWIIVMD